MDIIDQSYIEPINEDIKIAVDADWRINPSCTLVWGSTSGPSKKDDIFIYDKETNILTKLKKRLCKGE